MKRQKITVGAIFKINLNQGFYAYGRILNNANYAFYDFRTITEITDLHLIVSHPILFIISIFNHVITKGRWQKIGVIPLEEKLQQIPMKFIQDYVDISKISIYNPNTGEVLPASKEDCKGLERTVVWEGENVESRLEDYYNGKTNYWVERFKVK